MLLLLEGERVSEIPENQIEPDLFSPTWNRTGTESQLPEVPNNRGPSSSSHCLMYSDSSF